MTTPWPDPTPPLEPWPDVATLGLTFVTPALAIAGAAAVAIPILIHLLTRRRRTPIAWGAMRFLLEAYRKHRRRLTLEQLLLLACRCLVVLLLGLALARPMLGDGAGSQGATHLILLVDNSLTSQVREDGDTPAGTPRIALDRFKDEAGRLLSELDSTRGDRASVVTLSSPAVEIVWPHSADLAAVARVIQDIRAEDSRADVAGAFSGINSLLSEGGRSREVSGSVPRPRVVVALLSDLRSGSAELSRPLASMEAGPGAPIVTVLPPATTGVDNTAITSVEPVRPLMLSTLDPGEASPSAGGSGNQARVTLERFGPSVSRPASTRVRVVLSDPRTPPAADARAVTVAWQAGQRSATVIMDVDVEAGLAGTDSLALTALIEPDAVAADNIRVRSVEARRGVRVAVIESLRLVASPTGSIDRFSPGDWVRLVLRPDAPSSAAGTTTGLTPITIDPASVARGGLGGFDAVIILAPDELNEDGWRKVAEFLGSGGMVLVTPPADASVHVWGETMTTALGLDWAIGRDPIVYDAAVGISGEVAGGASNGLLGMMSGEMPALARPVSVNRRIDLRVGAGSPPPILALADGAAFLAASEPAPAGSSPEGRGIVAVLASAIDLAWTDLPTKPLMLPLVHETVRVGVGMSQVSRDRIAGHSGRVPPGTSDLAPIDARSREAGVWSPAASAAPRVSGIWRAVGSGGATIGLVAVNPDTAGSDTDVVPVEQATAWLGSLAGQDRVKILSDPDQNRGARSAVASSAGREGDPISVPLLVAALGLALIEVLLARWFSHAGSAITSDAGGSPA